MNKSKLNLLKSFLMGVLIFLGIYCIMLFVACKKSTATLIKVELVEGSYKTEYKLGEAPTLCGAELKLSFNDGSVNFIAVSESMVEQFDAEHTLVYSDEKDVSYDNEGNGFVITNHDLIAKYNDFIVDAQISIELPNYITVTADGAIKGYNNLSSHEVLIVPDRITTQSGKEITITKLMRNSLQDAPISAIVLPHTIKSIDRYAFKNCTELKQVLFLSDSEGNTAIDTISANAFEGCTSLESIDLPKSITYLYDTAFSACSALKEINIANGCANYYSTYGNAYKGVVYKSEVAYNAINYDNAYIWPLGKNRSTLTLVIDEDDVQYYSGPTGETVKINSPVKENHDFDGWFYDKECTEKVENLVLGEKDSTVYAKWKVSSSIKYNITYELNGGKNHTNNPDMYSIVSDDIELKVPERDGYNFEKWLEKLPDGSYLTNNCIPTGSKGNKHFEAIWTPTEYKINYELCGGAFDELSCHPLNYTVESDCFQISEPKREGYTFIGWQEGGVNLGTEIVIEAGQMKNRSLMAEWEPTEYQITYLFDGVANHNDNPSSYTVESRNTKLIAPDRDGYNLISWIVNGIKYGNNYSLSDSKLEDLSVEVEWEPIPCTIEYILQGGKNSHENPSTYNIESDDIYLMAPTFAGHYFTGWSENGVNLGKDFVIERGSFHNYVLTAHFENNVYQIIYEPNGGNGTMEPESDVVYLECRLAAKNVFVKDGYSFKNWLVTGAENVTQCDEGFDISTFIAENQAIITLTANWSANEYEVVFDENNGIGKTENLRYTYDTSSRLPANGFNRLGNDFIGWSLIPDGEVIFFDEQEVGNEVLNGNIAYGAKATLYAKWMPKSYNFDLNYCCTNFNVGDENRQATFMKAFKVSAPTRPGYVFGGWYYKDIKLTYDEFSVDNSGEGVTGFGILDIENSNEIVAEFDSYSNNEELVPLNAKWELITYRFTVKDDKDPTNQKTVEFDITTSKSTPEIRQDKFGTVFKQYTVNGPVQLKNGNTETNTFTDIKVGSYFTGVTPVKDENNQCVATVQDVHSEQYGKINTSLSSYNDDNGVVIFDLSQSAERQIVFVVRSRISCLTLIGNTNKSYNNFALKIENRSTPLRISFENFNYTAADGSNGITANSSFPLEICYLGKNSIYGANGLDGEDGASGTNYSVKADDGKAASNGTSAAYKKGAALNGGHGGDGSDGKDGGAGGNGSDGTDGCAAIYVVSMPVFISVNNGTLVLCGGNGGKGGDGGNGGRGQDGGNAGNGGNGGKGGNGGNGGNAGAAIFCQIKGLSPDSTVKRYAGTPGSAGKAGSGGEGGINGEFGHGGKNGKGQWYGSLATGAMGIIGIANIITEAVRDGGGEIGRPGNTATPGIDGAEGAGGAYGSSCPEIP